MLASRAIALTITTMLAGCLQGGPYACAADEQCRRPGSEGGTCEQGWCAYEDDMCPSGLRFSDNAGEGLANVCVEMAGTGGGTQDESSEGSSSSGGGGCPMPCTDPPGPCFSTNGTCESGSCVYAPLGPDAECEDDDPCSATSVCDGEGECIADVPVACDDPPSDCYAPTGTCNPLDGTCDYDFADVGTVCEDGDDCTEPDACDGEGMCLPGPVCPSVNPCEAGTCDMGTCIYTPFPDGTSCGMLPRDRCCAGTCVDISSDVGNCGGCGITCDQGYGCQSVDVTSTCDPAPPDTSGRCECGGNMNCDPGHVCRTENPYTNICTPDTAGACPGTFVNVDFCPNYCAY